MLVPIGEDFGYFEVEENDWPGHDSKFDSQKPLWKGRNTFFALTKREFTGTVITSPSSYLYDLS